MEGACCFIDDLAVIRCFAMKNVVDRGFAPPRFPAKLGLCDVEAAHPVNQKPVWANYGDVFPFTSHVRIIRTMRSEEHTSELQSLMRISYAVFCLKKKTTNTSLAQTII